VSLLWNAAEAVTMYLMFVRVFDSHVSHLGVSAIAWGACSNHNYHSVLKHSINPLVYYSHFVLCYVLGVPAMLVAINYAADNTAFDGSFVNCIFK
jgi:hypothetical protein